MPADIVNSTSAEKKLLRILLDQYFQGEETNFEQIPLDLTEQTPFVQKTLLTLQQSVSWSKSCSYKELAQQIECSSAQAVGQALGKNQILIVIPCHRVLPQHKKHIGGFNYDIKLKQKLLNLELQL